MRRRALSPIWIILGVALLAIAGLLLAMAFLDWGSVAPAPASTSTLSPTATSVPTTAAPDTPTPEPSPTPESIAASVNGYIITRSYLSQTVQLNQILGEVSGASVMGEEETLERLIRSRLILQGATAVNELTEGDVEGLIASLEQNWGVSDERLIQRLEADGLSRAFLVDTIRELLTVQAAVDSLENEGHNITEWLRQQEQDADIMVSEDLASAEEAEATPVAQPEVPDVAADFTLDRAGGGSLALRDQLEEGPVVLVFFEKCG